MNPDLESENIKENLKKFFEILLDWERIKEEQNVRVQSNWNSYLIVQISTKNVGFYNWLFYKNKILKISKNKVFKIYFKQRILSAKAIQNRQQNAGKI